MLPRIADVDGDETAVLSGMPPKPPPPRQRQRRQPPPDQTVVVEGPIAGKPPSRTKPGTVVPDHVVERQRARRRPPSPPPTTVYGPDGPTLYGTRPEDAATEIIKVVPSHDKPPLAEKPPPAEKPAV